MGICPQRRNGRAAHRRRGRELAGLARFDGTGVRPHLWPVRHCSWVSFALLMWGFPVHSHTCACMVETTPCRQTLTLMQSAHAVLREVLTRYAYPSRTHTRSRPSLTAVTRRFITTVIYYLVRIVRDAVRRASIALWDSDLCLPCLECDVTTQCTCPLLGTCARCPGDRGTDIIASINYVTFTEERYNCSLISVLSCLILGGVLLEKLSLFAFYLMCHSFRHTDPWALTSTRPHTIAFTCTAFHRVHYSRVHDGGHVGEGVDGQETQAGDGVTHHDQHEHV